MALAAGIDRQPGSMAAECAHCPTMSRHRTTHRVRRRREEVRRRIVHCKDDCWPVMMNLPSAWKQWRPVAEIITRTNGQGSHRADAVKIRLRLLSQFQPGTT